MYSINKITSNPTVDFAAEELKKHMRMMMPKCGEIPIAYAPDASDGFKLGLMSDFGIDCVEASDTELDDVVYIETDEKGGIIAGSNARSVLLAVYRYLRKNGCRWLFPGIDGELIPVNDIKPVSYRKMADYRYRGQCNEGAEHQVSMIDAIDFAPKIGMNIFMQEFEIPYSYYSKYYNHRMNPAVKPEPVTHETVLQWKTECECEISKRGLQYHDMGHGWTAEPLGISSAKGWEASVNDNLTDEQTGMLAMVDGKRGLYGGVPLNTNVCMSNPGCRKKIVNYIADYAQLHTNVDFLHIWLADNYNNHCECESCRKKTPSDWYVILLNETDAELTRRNLKSHLVFIVYVDTFWAPLTERLTNPSRYTMLYAPISRSYSETYAEPHAPEKLTPFNLNKNTLPKGMSECLAYLDEWRKIYSGDCCCYEYHFWRHQCFDFGHKYLARLIHDDIVALKNSGLNGIIEDGSQRSFFPNGFAFYVYGETLFDSSRTLPELEEDYFLHAYGERWREVRDYLDAITENCNFKYMSGYLSADTDRGVYYNPDVAPGFDKIRELCAKFMPVIEENRTRPKRAESIAWQLLENHAVYCDMVSKALALKARGEDDASDIAFREFIDEMGRREIYIARWYDGYLLPYFLERLFRRKAYVSVTQ